MKSDLVLYVVGQYLPGAESGSAWAFQFVCSSADEAAKRCITPHHFYAPIRVNAAPEADENGTWAGVVYPLEGETTEADDAQA